MNQKLRHASYSALSAKELESVWGEMESNLRAMPYWPILPSNYDTSRLVAVLRERAFTLKRFDSQALAGL
jgi:hypothetical protein